VFDREGVGEVEGIRGNDHRDFVCCTHPEIAEIGIQYIIHISSGPRTRLQIAHFMSIQDKKKCRVFKAPFLSLRTMLYILHFPTPARRSTECHHLPAVKGRTKASLSCPVTLLVIQCYRLCLCALPLGVLNTRVSCCILQLSFDHDLPFSK
jgi:hypothetical protein